MQRQTAPHLLTFSYPESQRKPWRHRLRLINDHIDGQMASGAEDMKPPTLGENINSGIPHIIAMGRKYVSKLKADIGIGPLAAQWPFPKRQQSFEGRLKEMDGGNEEAHQNAPATNGTADQCGHLRIVDGQPVLLNEEWGLYDK